MLTKYMVNISKCIYSRVFENIHKKREIKGQKDKNKSNETVIFEGNKTVHMDG